ncbi:DNA glycosylase [Rhizodiscina lignyota]|uniref:Endonuclease III homolog n=1 Tax=Rhizodiscina lignyota TaxID=1504668 RepID=A0A9P4IJR1_9PEZI|nr:DNA glycosylase [Rhizodiscina lignyota]
MRTSRIAQDTSRLVSALATNRTPPRRSLRGRSFAEVDNTLPNQNGSSTEAGSRKRKRGSNVHSSVTKIETSERDSNRIPESTAEVAKSSRARKARRQPAKKVVDNKGDVKIEPPPGWEEVYKLTQEMRSKIVAPVDEMGCEALALKTASPRDQRFQTLISLMLSSQTKDAVTAAAVKNLQDNLPGGLNLESILAVEPNTLNEFIGKVGFHNLKTKYIKNAAVILRDSYESDIPDTIAGLTSLPGVGPKMAYLCMSAAWGRDEGIGVDVHVHRITNLWGWHKTNTPEETRAALEAWLPKDKWHQINTLLVGLGQTVCQPVGRKCGECVLAERGLCPGAVVAKGTKSKKLVNREVKIKSDDGGDVIKEETEEVVEQMEIKAENVEDVGGESLAEDIEDIGLARRGSRQSRIAKIDESRL